MVLGTVSVSVAGARSVFDNRNTLFRVVLSLHSLSVKPLHCIAWAMVSPPLLQLLYRLAASEYLSALTTLFLPILLASEAKEICGKNELSKIKQN